MKKVILEKGETNSSYIERAFKYTKYLQSHEHKKILSYCIVIKKYAGEKFTVGERYKIVGMLDGALIFFIINDMGVRKSIEKSRVIIQKDIYKKLDFSNIIIPSDLSNVFPVERYVKEIEFVTEHKVHKHVIFKTSERYEDITKNKKYLIKALIHHENTVNLLDDAGDLRDISINAVIKVV